MQAKPETLEKVCNNVRIQLALGAESLDTVTPNQLVLPEAIKLYDIVVALSFFLLILFAGWDYNETCISKMLETTKCKNHHHASGYLLVKTLIKNNFFGSSLTQRKELW